MAAEQTLGREELRVLANQEFDFDFIYGVNRPRISYGLTGGQFALSADEEVAGKKPTDGPPIFIGTAPPGLFLADDDVWKATYASSHDSFLTIIPGIKVQESIDNVQVKDIYKNGLTNADDDNLWKKANEEQQVQYIASKDTSIDGESATDSFGEVSEARGLGIRLPGMAGGWGRTIDLLPTDPDATDDPQGRKNDEAHKLARETWKFGPIDARWDYRRNLWATYNDLIEDHYDQGLGTWVFGTNDDVDKGFPFLRGRLNDVWWVRQPIDLKDTDGKEEGIQTGRIMTHLKHEWFDESEDGSAPLSSIFIIPHTNETGDCHEKGDEHELGNEITGKSEKIDIRTSVHFFKEKDVDGPIKFGAKAEDLDNLCCDPGDDAHWFLGEMVFVPKSFTLPKCGQVGAGGAAAVVAGEGADECYWQPAVRIDECELVGEHFLKLINNDQSLAFMVCDLCEEVKTWSNDLISVIVDNDAILNDKIDDIQEILKKLVKDICAEIIAAMTASNTLAKSLAAKNKQMIEQLADTIFGTAQVVDGNVISIPGLTSRISDSFFECLGKNPGLPETQVRDANNNPAGTAAFDPSTASVVKPFIFQGPAGIAFAKPYKCELSIRFKTSRNLDTPNPFENCPTVDLEAPCAEPENFTVNCEGGGNTNITTKYGTCQTHED